MKGILSSSRRYRGLKIFARFAPVFLCIAASVFQYPSAGPAAIFIPAGRILWSGPWEWPSIPFVPTSFPFQFINSRPIQLLDIVISSLRFLFINPMDSFVYRTCLVTRGTFHFGSDRGRQKNNNERRSYERASYSTFRSYSYFSCRDKPQQGVGKQWKRVRVKLIRPCFKIMATLAFQRFATAYLRGKCSKWLSSAGLLFWRTRGILER